MIKVTIDAIYYPIYEAYCRSRSILFHILGGGWRKSYVKDGKELMEYKIWGADVEFLRYMCSELPC